MEFQHPSPLIREVCGIAFALFVHLSSAYGGKMALLQGNPAWSSNPPTHSRTDTTPSCSVLLPCPAPSLLFLTRLPCCVSSYLAASAGRPRGIRLIIMPPERRQKKAPTPSEDGSTAAAKPHSKVDTPVGASSVAALGKDNAPIVERLSHAGDKSCPGTCCRNGERWVRRHIILEEFPRALGTTGLDTYSWVPVSAGVQELAMYVRNRGLAPWAELPPAVREKMGLWSPVAQQLCGSDFGSHQEALVRAWIWHYLDDNLLSFSGDVPSAEYPSWASPVWNHVRALRHELDGKQCAAFFGLFPLLVSLPIVPILTPRYPVLRSGRQDLDR